MGLLNVIHQKYIFGVISIIKITPIYNYQKDENETTTIIKKMGNFIERHSVYKPYIILWRVDNATGAVRCLDIKPGGYRKI